MLTGPQRFIMDLKSPQNLIWGFCGDLRSIWMARHDPNVPIAKWIAKICNAATDLASMKHTPNDQQICDRLLRGLDDAWKPICNHLVYSLIEVSLDDAIGALESHEVLTQVLMDHFDPSASVAKIKTTLGCYNCSQKGHQSSHCPNPSIKKKFTTRANATEARAGSASFATLGNYESEDDKDEDVHKNDDGDDCNVVWG
ncbi:hypothetical protein PTTG_09115 [Puccinia triticina 1-1 BBBD Race 1]|uniref:CCHC-type domain-containing protein n=1 Tax=Puccinia triticina (isolate 1-1 / race 1 (BBBD)) TaxID=630390 RepID=A0A0C4F7I2_PUCT1|nr:hypothetical protein PTTG_09115 [Puccinia triticina 1-1 BBBD Race 1]